MMRHWVPLRIAPAVAMTRFLMRAAVALALLCGLAGGAWAQTGCPLTMVPKLVPGTSYTITTTDYCWWIIASNSGAITVNLPAPGLIFPPGWYTTILNEGGGTITFQGMPDDAGRVHDINGVTTLTLGPGQGAALKIQQDMNWYAIPSAGILGTPGSITNEMLQNDGLTFGSTAAALGSTVSAINGVSVGQATPEAGAFTNLSATGSVALPNGSIANAMLANSNVTFAGVECALGGSCALSASDLSNGVTGSGSVVLAAAPTFTGVANFSGGLAAATAAQVSGTIAPHVPTEAALAAAATTQYPNGVWRDDYASGTGAMALFYVPSGSACSLNSGAGDGGSQVPSADSKCWLWRPPPSGVTPLEFGCAGNGTSNDLTCVQNAVMAVEVAGIPLVLDTSHLYYTPGTINVTSPFKIVGAARYGIWTSSASGTYPACAWGFLAAASGGASATLFNVSAVTATFDGVCIQMATGNSANATAGSAIAFAPPSTSTYQTSVRVDNSTIINPYDGITFNGAGYSNSCCGAGTSADGPSAMRNTIVSPADAAISVGKNTAGAATVGITLTDNAIVCNNTTSKTSGMGVALYDGGIWGDGTQNGAEACNIGLAVIPGTVSGVGQNAQLDWRGVAGDQSATHDLLMQPSTSLGGIGFSECDNCWASGTAATDNEVLISTANGGTIETVKFVGGAFHSGANASVPIFDVEATNSGGALYNLQLIGMSVQCWGGGTCTAPGLKINLNAGTVGRIVVNGNQIGGNGGTLQTGFLLEGTNMAFATVTGNDFSSASTTAMWLITGGGSNSGLIEITGNDLSTPGTALVYTPNSGDSVDIAHNIGIDNLTQPYTETSGAIVLNNADNSIVLVTGGTPAINSITPVWQNREIEMQASASGFTLATGGSTGPICKDSTVAQGQIIRLRWRNGGSCWSPSI